jgi:hypothetical protein
MLCARNGCLKEGHGISFINKLLNIDETELERLASSHGDGCDMCGSGRAPDPRYRDYQDPDQDHHWVFTRDLEWTTTRDRVNTGC